MSNKMYGLIHRLFITIFVFALVVACQPKQPESATLTKEALKNKIKGAWAAQTIGVTFCGTIEFQYYGTIVQDYQTVTG